MENTKRYSIEQIDAAGVPGTPEEKCSAVTDAAESIIRKKELISLYDPETYVTVSGNDRHIFLMINATGTEHTEECEAIPIPGSEYSDIIWIPGGSVTEVEFSDAEKELNILCDELDKEFPKTKFFFGWNEAEEKQKKGYLEGEKIIA